MTLPEIPAFRVLAVDDNDRELRPAQRGRAPLRQPTPAHGTFWCARGTTARRRSCVNVTLNFGNIPQGLAAHRAAARAKKRKRRSTFTRAPPGILEARLYPKDAFAADNYAALELPELRSLHVIVYSDQPDALRPALASDPRVAAEFRPNAQYVRAKRITAALVILHHFRPETRPQGNVLWIDPPPDKPPVAIQSRVEHPEGLRWMPDQPLTAGLRARDVQIEAASVFAPSPKDIRLAEVDERARSWWRTFRPTARSRNGGDGFRSFRGAMRYELATPLLLANVLRWVAPDVFRDVDVGTQSAGAVADAVCRTRREAVQVITDSGTNLPFNVRDKAVEFFAGESARVRVIAGNSERVYSLTLPEMWDVKWTPPANVRHGIPAWNDSIRRNRDWWPFLAALGAAVLIGEWIAYGRYSPARLRVVKPSTGEGRMTSSISASWAAVAALLCCFPLALGWPLGLAAAAASRASAVEGGDGRRGDPRPRRAAFSYRAPQGGAGGSGRYLSQRHRCRIWLAKAQLLQADRPGARQQSGRRDPVRPHAASAHRTAKPVSSLPAPRASTGAAPIWKRPIRQALASLPAGMLHRIALITDGNENDGRGHARRLAGPATGRSDRHDRAGGQAAAAAQDRSRRHPRRPFSPGERFPVDLTIYSPRATPATVELSAEGKQIGARTRSRSRPVRTACASAPA